MVDAALLKTCSDPALSPAIVEQFVQAAGSDDPLAITVKIGGRLLVVPKPQSPEEALDLVRQHVGKASVRVGITQMPAGIGITAASQLDLRLFDACKNLEKGTAMFAKVARIVTRWYGSPTNKEVVPQMVEDTIYAWKSGTFEGTNVFQAADPGGATFLRQSTEVSQKSTTDQAISDDASINNDPARDATRSNAEMRIDLTRIGAGK